jgi:hypothetical protein
VVAPQDKSAFIESLRARGVQIFGAPLAVEYSAPTEFVVGPLSERDQFENPGQFYIVDDGPEHQIYIFIP